MRIKHFIISLIMLFISQLAHGRAVLGNITLNDYISTNCSQHCVDEESLLTSVMKAGTDTSTDIKMLIAIIKVESSFNRQASSHGNKGLMQLHVKVHRKKLQGRSPFDMDANIAVGNEIYSSCYMKHKDPWKALRCYNGYPKNNKYVDAVRKAYRDITRLVGWNDPPSYQPYPHL